MKIVMKINLFVLFVFFANNLISQTEYSEINTNSDERGIAFSMVNNSKLQIWRTTGFNCINPKSRKIEISSGNNINFSNAGKINRNQEIDDKIFFDGSPSFPICPDDSIFFNWGLIVSNRYYNEKDFDNDIYVINYNNQTDNWELGRRIDEINSPYWDDTPAISPDGKVIIFASSREAPSSAITNLFISKLTTDGKWSKPEIINIINEPNSSQVSPFFGYDGYLYFSSNKSGDFDIYRIKFDNDCEISGSYEELPKELFPDVNKIGTDELSPSFSPGGQFFLFSSNRKDNSISFDVYFIKANNILKLSNEIKFTLKCWELLDTLDFYKEIDKREKKPCISTLKITDGNNSFVKKTDDNAIAQFSLPRYNGYLPHQDMFRRETQIKVTGECCNGVKRDFVLVFNSFCQNELESDLELLCNNKPVLKFPFIIDSIPFFVTSYWCPSTNEFKDKKICGCTSIFNIDTKCEATPSEYQVEFDYPCESNEVYTFSNKSMPIIKPSYNVYKTAGSCIDLMEMNKIKNKIPGFDWSEKVDKQINSLITQMEKTLQNAYVNYALEKNIKLIVNIYGWTDFRQLDKRCKYTGDDIDLESSKIILDSEAMLHGKITKKNYIIDNKYIKKNTKFVNQWLSGNQLLSDLRAFYMANLLNNLWMKIPKFEYLANKNQIEIRAIGRGIKDKPGVPLHYNRSVDVEVIIDQGDELFFKSVSEINPIDYIRFRVPPCKCNK